MNGINFQLFSNDERKNAVYELQHYLRFLSKHLNDIPTVTPDGIFGKETERAVTAFQKKYYIPQTGEVDLNTWNLIRDTYLDIREDTVLPEPVYIFPPEIVSMSKGDDYAEILILQILIRKLSHRFNNVPPVTLSGVFDNETEVAVKQLQNIFGLENHGKVDRKTWNRLSRLHSSFTLND